MKDYSASELLANDLIDYISEHNLIRIIDVGGIPVAIWTPSAESQLTSYIADKAGDLEEVDGI